MLFSYWLAAPAGAGVWSFYLFGDLFSTLMVATFFAFLNDAVNPDTAKRLYGLVGLGGVAGGVFGSTVVRVNIERLDYADWLWLCVVLGVLIMLAAWSAGRRVQKPANQAVEEPAEEPAGHPATEGARLVFSSRYLLSIVAIVGLYEVISTIMDFQFTATIAHYLSGPDIGAQFSLVFAITNWVSLLVQLFLTGFVMTRFGLGVALLVLPCSVALGSSAFLLFPILWTGKPAQHGGQWLQLLYQPVRQGSPLRAHLRGGEVPGQGLHRHVCAAFRQGGGGGDQPGTDLRLQRLRQPALPQPGHPGPAGGLGVIAARYAGRRFREYEEQAAPQAP